MRPEAPGSDLDARTRAEWRSWLEQHSGTAREIWLVLHNKGSDVAGLDYAEAIEEALCFGWIDSQAKRRDTTSRYQRFSPRRRGSKWSAVNRARAERLIAAGFMTERGMAAIEHAKHAGTWGVSEGGLNPR